MRQQHSILLHTNVFCCIKYTAQYVSIPFRTQPRVLHLWEREKVCLQTYSHFLSLLEFLPFSLSKQFRGRWVERLLITSWKSRFSVRRLRSAGMGGQVGAFPWQHLLPLSHKPFSFLVEKQKGKAKSSIWEWFCKIWLFWIWKKKLCMMNRDKS